MSNDFGISLWLCVCVCVNRFSIVHLLQSRILCFAFSLNKDFRDAPFILRLICTDLCDAKARGLHAVLAKNS